MTVPSPEVGVNGVGMNGHAVSDVKGGLQQPQDAPLVPGTKEWALHLPADAVQPADAKTKDEWIKRWGVIENHYHSMYPLSILVFFAA
jgi:hypothetical protein